MEQDSHNKGSPAGLRQVLGPLELRVMEALWANCPSDVSEVQQSIGTDSAYSTVKTILERLTEKGMLRREKVGRAFHYVPAVSRSELEASSARQLSSQLVQGFGAAALSHFVEQVSEDPQQLRELRRLLDELERG